MRTGVVASVVLHVGALGLAFVSLPESWRSKINPEPVIPIELLTEAELSELTSVPAARPEPPKEEPEPEPEVAEPEEIKPAPPKEEPKPEPEPEPEPAPLPDPEPEQEPEPPKEEPKPKPKPEPENDDLDFDQLSALVDKAREDEPEAREAPSETTLESDRVQQRVGAGDRLTASDTAKMQAAIARCWQTSALIGAPEPEKLVVRLEIKLNRDGTLSGSPRTMNAMEINLSGNRFWKSAEQIAQRAVVACQPYDFLSLDRYDVWREMELNFDPSLMAGF